MSVENVNVLTMASEMSVASHSSTSRNLREYVDIVREKVDRYPGMLTDLRDKKTLAEEATGKVFTVSA
ncbi:hypothetical protein [Desulfocurvus sp. DL9XJH121]